MMDFQASSWESYFYPETIGIDGNGVLINHLGLRDGRMLAAAEDELSAWRILQWISRPLASDFSYAHFKAVHRHIFQDIYPWAGQERTVGMQKAGHPYYPPGPGLTAAAEAQFASLARADFLRGLPRDEFVLQLAEAWGEINVVHSFREGNTRTQSVFFAQLAEMAGHPLPLHKLARQPLRDKFVRARFHSQVSGSNAHLADVLDQVVVLETDHSQKMSAVEVRTYIQERIGEKLSARFIPKNSRKHLPKDPKRN